MLCFLSSCNKRLRNYRVSADELKRGFVLPIIDNEYDQMLNLTEGELVAKRLYASNVGTGGSRGDTERVKNGGAGYRQASSCCVLLGTL